jgi:hypothetical protein
MARIYQAGNGTLALKKRQEVHNKQLDPDPGKRNLLRELLLSFGQFATALVIRAEQSRCAVHDNEREPAFNHHGRRLGQQLHLMLGVVRARHGHVVEHVVRCGANEESQQALVSFRVRCGSNMLDVNWENNEKES